MNFNPRAPYGARPGGRSGQPAAPVYFNPRAPYGARPPASCRMPAAVRIFQSSRPLRGATPGVYLVAEDGGISILAPLTGRDSYGRDCRNRPITFQSSRPLRGATAVGHRADADDSISILAPLTGRDARRDGRERSRRRNFNPRAPYGARPRQRGGERDEGDISILAPLTGRDSKNAQKSRVFLQ